MRSPTNIARSSNANTESTSPMLVGADQPCTLCSADKAGDARCDPGLPRRRQHANEVQFHLMSDSRVAEPRSWSSPNKRLRNTTPRLLKVGGRGDLLKKGSYLKNKNKSVRGFDGQAG